MAAYGALVSLMHIIDTLEKHPSPPISILREQVESLTQNVTFLQEFLDGYISPVFADGHEGDPLERRIADAVYAAEDAIESEIVLQIDRRSTIVEDHDFYQNLPKVIEEMSLIKKEVVEKQQNPVHAFKFPSARENAMVGFDEDFLDGYISPVASSHEADAVYSAGDVLQIDNQSTTSEDNTESQIVVQNVRRPTVCRKVMGLIRGVCKCASASATATIEEGDEEMNLIKNEATEAAAVAQLQREVSSTHAGSPTSYPRVNENVMVGFDEVFFEVLDKLTGSQLSRQIIPVMGMGGIGKTTLARNLFDNALVKEHFDVRAWTTISQTYNVRETIRELYVQASGESSDLSEDNLGEKLYKCLSGRRYLVIMDDMWSVEVWDEIKFFFPDYQNGSRIIVTTRQSDLSSQLNESYRVGMKFLDKASSWDLFCKTVFGQESCPIELENTGKNIVANCKGLPLSIATIGGLLAKSESTVEYWERIKQNLNSIVINSNDEFCLKILRMSYIFLPNYLKPCFLYMGVFEEDHRIRVSMLEKLWISEGFLKPRSGKCLETIAREYFKELVDRNLILVDELGSTGNVKYCKIHDLLRDLCLKEVVKERLYHVIGRSGPIANTGERRVVFSRGTAKSFTTEVLKSLLHARSIICDGVQGGEARLSHNLRLLRTFKASDDSRYGDYFMDKVFELMNARYLAVRVHNEFKLPSSIDLLWNLHTLVVKSSCYLTAPAEIWKLHQLRHLDCSFSGLFLPDPPSGDNDIVIMENLQTLKGVINLFLKEEVVKRIPNVKKLHVWFNVKKMEEENCLSYLQCLRKLENFRCEIEYGCDEYWQRIRFPGSLKKLSVIASFDLELEDIMPKIGLLPRLEKFVLKHGFFGTGKWETIEGHFPSLKFLQLSDCKSLEDWIVSDNSHFPRLQKLRLHFLGELKEIPSEIGEIATLKSVWLHYCSESAVLSAKKIVEEQDELYGMQLDLHVHQVKVQKHEEALN